MAALSRGAYGGLSSVHAPEGLSAPHPLTSVALAPPSLPSRRQEGTLRPPPLQGTFSRSGGRRRATRRPQGPQASGQPSGGEAPPDRTHQGQGHEQQQQHSHQHLDGGTSPAHPPPHSPSRQPGTQPGRTAIPADPLWRDVFPEYLQNRETDSWATEGAPQAHSLRGQGMEAGLGYPGVHPGDAVAGRYVGSRVTRVDPIWAAIRAEAKLEAEREPILSSFLYASILAHDCLERSVAFVLANRLKNVTLLATQLMDVFDDVMARPDLQDAIRADLQAVRDRDPSCRSYSNALLYYKGFHALQSYRIAHALWNRGQQILALALQSRISEVFAVDIHPAARIGRGILMDHGTGVVIGETAVVGDRVSMLQGVTLGGTGKEAGDRHPKVQEGVLIGAGATILGNIVVGRGSMVAAGSLVLKDVPPHSMVAGTPAKIVGTLQEDTPSLTMKHDVPARFWPEDSSKL